MRGSEVAVDRRHAAGMRIAILISRYHAPIARGLEAGVRAALDEAGIDSQTVPAFEVPGAFELPQAARRIAERGDWDALVCVGCLIRGETPHFDYIAQAAADGITRAAQDTGVPMAFGVLTTNTREEAEARSADGPLNKGREAGLAAVGLARLFRTLAATATRTSRAAGRRPSRRARP